MTYAWLNVGSLLLGLLAWALPIINLARQNKSEHVKWFVDVFISVSACAVSLFFQILYGHHLQNIRDWYAIIDTSLGLVLASTVLLLVTLTLNIFTIIAYSKTDTH